MNQFWDQLGTGLGDILINTQQPFGTLGGPPLSPEQRSPVIQQGLLSLGANILADNTRNPFQALGQGYNATRAQGAANQLGGLRANMDQTALNQNLFELSNAQKRKKAQEEFAKTLPPSERAKFEADPENYMAQSLQAQFAPESNGMTEYGLTPIPLADKNGNFSGYGVLGKDGSMKRVDGDFMSPYGVNYNKAAGSKAGGAEGVSVGEYKSMKSKLPSLQKVVTELNDLAEKATYTLAGQVYNWGRTQAGMSPSEGQIARTEYVAKVRNQIFPILRDTFGAQFTRAEGEALLTTLGDPDKTPKEKQVVLEAFIEQKVRDVEAKAAEAGLNDQSPVGASGGPQAGDVMDGYRFKGGNPADPNSWEPAQ